MDLKLEDLQLFVDLAQSTSLRELARRNKTVPSQISKKILALERKVGKRLLYRSASGISLSSDGIRFWKAAGRTLEMSRGLWLDTDAHRQTATAVGRVYSIAGASYLNHHLLPEVLANLRRSGSNERFQLLEGASKDLVANGMRGQFEMALYLGKMEWPKSWVSKKIGAFPSRLYSRLGHILGKRATEDEVRKFKFVLPIHQDGNQIKFGDDGCPLAMDQRLLGDSVATADAALEWIRVTDQLAYLPRVVARRAWENREIEEIEVDEWKDCKQHLYISVKADQVPSRMLNEIVAALEKKIKALE